MKSSSELDLQQLSSSSSSIFSQPPTTTLFHRNNNNRGLVMAHKTLTKPAVFFALLVLSFVLGYLSHTAPAPKLNLQVVLDDLSLHKNFSTQLCSDPIPRNKIRQKILNQVFNGTSPWKNFPPAHVDRLLMKGWSRGWGSNTPVFEHLIKQVRPMIIIEVGTFLGASATHMAGLTRSLGLDSLIICVDDFRGWPGYYDDENSLKMVNGDSLLLYQFMQNVAHANATKSILFLPFSAGTALTGLCEWGVFGDLVEIDAAHDFHSAWRDINNAYKVLRRPHGVMFGHDYAWEGVRNAVHMFAKFNGFTIRIDGEHWVLY